MSSNTIRIRGARQNNLRHLDLDIAPGQLVVLTGVSGSGKSSLAFDTIYAEGQRRYVETFSPYARQFLDRMDRAAADRIEGIPPAIAIDQTNPVRTSRSTVGTMTELNDHLKLLFARAAVLYCRDCGRRVERDTPDGIYTRLLERASGRRASVRFRLAVPENTDVEGMRELLAGQGYTRVSAASHSELDVTQDRIRIEPERRGRIIEALEAALHAGQGRLEVQVLDDNREPQHSYFFSSALHCADCDIRYRDPVPNLFSFNSPMGACDHCRGFGRVMGIDYNRVIPDERLSLAEGAIRPWQSGQSAECQQELLRHAHARGIATDIPWRDLPEADRRWVIEGEGSWRSGRWYGVQRYFDWLERKSYKMHVRVLLSRYRSYDLCPVCNGARLQTEALCWRLGSRDDADRVMAPEARQYPHGAGLPDATLRRLPGLNLHDVMQLPLGRTGELFDSITLPAPLDDAASVLLDGIRGRLHYLHQVGLGYLTLDRQSRTLSGGEVQRINLTTALGTSLVNTLFVLDEPSIGLHPRDMDRIIDVMLRLRQAGNTLIVVEHDPQVMLAADRIIDIGPGPGEHGGEIVFDGAPVELMASDTSLTGAYLTGRRAVAAHAGASADTASEWLIIRDARDHNLRGIDVHVPLNRLAVLTGVSGSGKSTLMVDVLYRGICQLRGHPTDPPGEHEAIEGHDQIDDVVLIDQAPIGKSTRSNPASYVGAYDAIRKAFVKEPLARERGYTAGTFSFNSGNGRCPGCGGNGFEHIEMQFLADVYLRCPDCDGRRFRDEVLEVTLPPSQGVADRPRSIADVLELTVTEALGFFADYPAILRALEPLQAVGLGYLRLGQSVPTLSGGEAQRLKLAGHLAKAARRRSADSEQLLFLFDEPTTGLHFQDVSVLLDALRRLLQAGHSVLVIEHNLDVMRAADWLIDLGPDGGEAGGQLLAESPPHRVTALDTPTGRVLANNEPAFGDTASSAAAEAPAPYASDVIRIHHAREHNLKGIDIAIPRQRLTVVTGISGSGKSTVAFDILFNEGQRRYLESLNAYARQMVQPAARPDVDAVDGIPPTVAIEQRTSRGGRKSTVATMTEVYHFLRLLFVKLGTQYCPDCDVPIREQSRASIRARLLRDYRGQNVRLLAPMIVARKGIYKELAQWAAGKGFETLRVDGEDCPTANWPELDRYHEHTIDLPVASLTVSANHEVDLDDALAWALAYGDGTLRLTASTGETLLSTERACPDCGRSFAELDPRLFSYNSKHGWCPDCVGTGEVLPDFDPEDTGDEARWQATPEGDPVVCPSCDGQRLNRVALAVRFRDRSIGAFTSESVRQAARTFADLELSERESTVGRDILPEIRNRLAFLAEVGLDYLTLDRGAPTLSGGEAQRIRLAAQLGSNLQGVCYVMDEPTIGLHPRDNRMLLDTLARLEGKGNTIVVVEHDEDTIRRAEHVIDLGPGAGVEGGRVVASGNVDELTANPDSVTGRHLNRPLTHPLRGNRRTTAVDAPLRITGAHRHNLQYVDLALPLQRLIAVTGVSGSGKSTLVRDVLYNNLKACLDRETAGWYGCQELVGWEAVDRVLEVDQSPIGKTPRSCPATYVGFWDDIRRLFASTEEATLRGYGAGRFSFNTKEGRCPACDGQGRKRIEMNFLPDVTTPCDECHGQRFMPETLAVQWRGYSIGDILLMSIDEAVALFAAHPRIHHPLRLLQDTGLGYLTLGQQSPTLSGGEAQRLKLVTELAKARPQSRRPTPHTLYVLDEPTVGLHMADVDKLARVLHRLVDDGNTVVVIEHNLDIVAESDWVVDMGPEGGDDGGRCVAAGSPEAIAGSGAGHTPGILREFLAERGTQPGTAPE